MNNDEPLQTKNDQAWNKLFSELDILREIEEKGKFVISAQQIKSISNREPRLMAKFDHSENLPKIFQDNNLTILPIARGSYVISNFDIYHKFEDGDADVSKFSLPDYLQSLNADDIFSETVALNCALAAGILDDFLEDSNLQPTVSGRMKSGDFSFSIHNNRTGEIQSVDVSNAQIEIDAAYEGVKSLAIFEAKNDLSADFLVRQLFYPYSTWRNKVTKPVRPVFVVYSNGIYRLYEYCFEKPDDYNSLRLLKFKKYSVEDTDISLSDVQNIFENVSVTDEPSDIPLPQADDFNRVINLCELLNENQQMSRNDVTENYGFNPRQTNYYVDAARYLGLVQKGREDGEVVYSLTSIGQDTLKLKYKARQLRFCELILQHGAFNMTFEQTLELGATPARGQIVNNMKITNPEINSDITLERRASTIRGWIEWILAIINKD